MNEKNTNDRFEKRDENRDPLSGAPGAHPVGTGVGAAGGGAAGAAIGTALGGPVGAAVGIVAGAIVGGLAGKGAAEAVDPTAEDAYWRENYRTRNYVEGNAPYETYQPAFRTGYEGFSRYPDRPYDEVEADLRRDYERAAGRSALGWDKARHAARDAWTRVETARAQRQAPPATAVGSSAPETNSNALGRSAAAATSKKSTNSGESGTSCGCS